MLTPKRKSMRHSLSGPSKVSEHFVRPSVMTPMLILCGIVVPAMVPAIYFTTGHIQEILTYVIVLVVVVALVWFTIFAICDPDRLQTEDYRVEMRRIDMIGEPGKLNAFLDLESDQTPNTYVENKQGAATDGH